MSKRRTKSKRRTRMAGTAARGRQPTLIDFYEHALNINMPGSEMLYQRCREVERIDREIFLLCAHLLDLTKRDPNCLGIAAPQIGSPLRIFTMREERGGDRMYCFVNPTVEAVEGALSVVEYEGCFSIPWRRAKVDRASAVVVRGLAPSGDPCEMKFAGLAARIAQHEIDHLDGMLISGHAPLEALEGDVIQTGEKLRV